jgi:hypothetical protein
MHHTLTLDLTSRLVYSSTYETRKGVEMTEGIYEISTGNPMVPEEPTEMPEETTEIFVGFYELLDILKKEKNDW